MTMLIVPAESTRAEHPLDVVERFASEHEFAFDRDHEDEIAISTRGALAEYHVAFTWLEDVEAVLIKKALARFNGNVSHAANALGLSRSALYRRLQRYGL